MGPVDANSSNFRVAASILIILDTRLLNICGEIGLLIKSVGLISKPIFYASLELFAVKKTTEIDAVISFS